MRVLIHYIVNAGDSVSPEFMRALAERLPQHEDKLMTIAERLEQKGRSGSRRLIEKPWLLRAASENGDDAGAD